jgi:hypothetical protein
MKVQPNSKLKITNKLKKNSPKQENRFEGNLNNDHCFFLTHPGDSPAVSFMKKIFSGF